MRKTKLGMAVQLGISAVLVSFALAQPAAAANTVTCKETKSKVAYKFDFNWQNDTATISVRNGSAAWKPMFKGATAVRNSASDPSFLAEGTAKQWSMGFGGKCGRFIATHTFDVAKKGSKLVGTLEKAPQWVASNGGKTCKTPAPAPELASDTVELTCQ